MLRTQPKVRQTERTNYSDNDPIGSTRNGLVGLILSLMLSSVGSAIIASAGSLALYIKMISDRYYPEYAASTALLLLVFIVVILNLLAPTISRSRRRQQ